MKIEDIIGVLESREISIISKEKCKRSRKESTLYRVMTELLKRERKSKKIAGSGEKEPGASQKDTN